MCAGTEPEMNDIADSPPTLLDGDTVHGEYYVTASIINKFRLIFHDLKSE